YYTFSPFRHIVVMDSSGENPVSLGLTEPESGFQPVWSPDGSMIAFASERAGAADIYTMNADGSNQARITNDPADDSYPSWGIVPLPVVTKLKPASGPVSGGSTVTITGTFLTGASAVMFGSTAASSFKVNSAT